MKIRKPKNAPFSMTVTFRLLGDENERMAQYMFVRMHEKTGTLSSEMQAFYQTAFTGMSAQEWADWSEGLVSADDISDEHS
jgi:hypothetical protein